MTVDAPLIVRRPTRAAFWREYLLVALLLGLAFGLAVAGLAIPGWGIWAAAALAVLILGTVEFNRLRSLYKITPSQVVIEDGIISKQRKSVFLNNIADLNVQQGWLQRLLGWGAVVIGSSSGRDTTELRLLVRRPRNLIHTLEKLIRNYEGQEPSSARRP